MGGRTRWFVKTIAWDRWADLQLAADGEVCAA
jgi:hypothetical protein